MKTWSPFDWLFLAFGLVFLWLFATGQADFDGPRGCMGYGALRVHVGQRPDGGAQ